jgi:hypothetical protein
MVVLLEVIDESSALGFHHDGDLLGCQEQCSGSLPPLSNVGMMGV